MDYNFTKKKYCISNLVKIRIYSVLPICVDDCKIILPIVHILSIAYHQNQSYDLNLNNS